MGFDEEDAYTSSDEVDSVKSNDSDDNDGDESQKDNIPNSPSSPSSPRNRQASSAKATTPDDHTSLPRKREGSYFSNSRSNSIATAGVMADSLIRRRTRLASSARREGETSGSGSTFATDPVGTIAQASRIITDLPQEPGGFMFPLDSVMGDGSFEQDGCDKSD